MVVNTFLHKGHAQMIPLSCSDPAEPAESMPDEVEEHWGKLADD